MRRMHGGVETAVASADTGAETTMPSNPLVTQPGVTTGSDDIKVEQSNLPSALDPVMTGVDIKAEPYSPPSTPVPVMADVDVKTEPSSSPSTSTPPNGTA